MTRPRGVAILAPFIHAGGNVGTGREVERNPDRQLGDRAQFRQGALRDQEPTVHDQDMLGAILELVERVRRDQHGGAVVAQFVQDLVEGLAQRGVEARRRLVQQQHRGPAQQRLRQSETLAHALRIGPDPAVGRIASVRRDREEAHALDGLIVLQPRIERQRFAPRRARR